MQSVTENNGTVILRLIPWLLSSGGNPFVKPPAKLFNPLEYPQDQVQKDGTNEYVYGKQFFSKGFLIKRFKLNQVEKTQEFPKPEIFLLFNKQD